LRRLDLSHLIYNGDFLDSLLEFYARLNEHWSLRRLALNNVDLYNGDMFTQHLADLLVHNENLTSLSATYYNFGLDGTRLLSSVLRRRETSFRYLDLSEAGINDEACEVLVGALEGHSLLRSLELNGNYIRNGGCVAISNNLLKNPRSILVRLYLDNNSIDDEGAEALADGLGGNKCLKTLSIHGNAAITSRGYGAFSKALCNAPRIDDILLSNHNIQRLAADENQLSEELKSSLRFNQYVHKQYAANRKVAMHHFIYTCNMELFESISGSLVPLVIATIADHASPATNRTGAEAKKHCAFVKEDYRVRHLALHKIIRLCPSVCERRVGTTDGKLPAIGSPKRMRIAQKNRLGMQVITARAIGQLCQTPIQ